MGGRRAEQCKYPELWDSTGTRRSFAKQVLYADEVDRRGTFFETSFNVVTKGGSVDVKDGQLKVQGAQEVVLMLSAASSYNGPQNSPSRQGADASLIANKDLAAATIRGFQELKAPHLHDYGVLFNRASLALGKAGAASSLPTDERIARFHEGNDPSLAALYVHFARYLTIAASRAGTQPLNLQGIWNKDVIPPLGIRLHDEY